LIRANEILRQRIAKVKKAAVEKNAGNLWITKPENKFYLTGFVSSNYFILLTDSKDYLLTDFRYIEGAKYLKDLFELVLITNQFTPIDFLKNYAQTVLAIEYKSITFDFYNDIIEKSLVKHVVSADLIIDKIREIKTPDELLSIKRAAEIANLGFEHLLGYIKPGLTEKEIAFELEFFMKKNGADDLAFDSIVASGARGSLPHSMPTDKAVQKGDFITMDFGAKIMGYCSDMTRTIGIGPLNAKQKEIYALVLEAQVASLGQLRVGAKASDLDGTARNIITAAGYGTYFGHGLGHGVGLEIHEAPTLNPTSGEILEPNMVVTIEPGIYLPAEFGVRIEDLAVVTNSDIITLSSVEKELIIL